MTITDISCCVLFSQSWDLSIVIYCDECFGTNSFGVAPRDT